MHKISHHFVSISRFEAFTRRHLFMLLLIWVLPVYLFAADSVKSRENRQSPISIFCLGDSITQGFGLVDAEGKQAMNQLGYPAKLGALLGSQARVNLYGAGGTTFFRNGPHPFEKTAWKAYAQISKPDIVTLAFGTNCSNDKSWPTLHAQYAADVKWLINEVRLISPKVEIYICLPPPAYSDKWGINERTIQKAVIPALIKIAAEEHLKTIDLHTALSQHPECFSDTIHPNETGMQLIAQTIAERLYQTRDDLVRPAVTPPTAK